MRVHGPTSDSDESAGYSPDDRASQRELFHAGARARYGLLVVDESGVIIEANAQMSELLGFVMPGLIGRPLSDLFPVALEEELRRARRDLQGLLDGLPAKIAYWDADLKNRFANQHYRAWHFIGSREILGRHMSEVISPVAYEETISRARDALAGKPQEFERTFVGDKGEPRYVLINFVPDVGASSVVGFFVLGTDITLRRRAEDALAEERERSSTILTSIADAVLATDGEGRVTYLNPVAQQMTGWDERSAKGREAEEVMVIRDATSGEAIANPLRLAMKQGTPAAIPPDCMLISRNGTSYLIEDSAAPIRDSSDKVIGGVLVFHDVSEAHKLATMMAHLARHDSLTDLPNRRVLRERVEFAIDRCKRDHSSFAVIFVDIDHFKEINDSYGHAAGDELLKSVARRLRTTLRSIDTVCRQGGDEFVVVLEEVSSPSEVAKVATKILTAIEGPLAVEASGSAVEVFVRASIGIAICPEDGNDVDSLLHHADAAMYSAKKDGRNRFSFFSEELERQVSTRRRIVGALQASLAVKDFRIAYQPIVSATTGEIVSLEALVRWQRTPDQVVLPGDFIEIAEESGLILPLGAWILREVCDQFGFRVRSGLPPIPIKVNISPRQFRDPGLVEQVKSILSDTGVDPRWLELEITEGSLMERVARTHEALEVLRAMGVRVGIDDFGTGYSSLNYLRRLPVKTLKIDRSFAPELLSIEGTGAIVAAICDLGGRLGLEIIAEGIEEAGQVRFLIDSNCTLMQGYLFARPVDSADLASFLLQWDPNEHIFDSGRKG